MLKLRILSAAVLGSVLAAALFWLPPLGWSALALAVIAVAAWEWGGFARLRPATRVLYAAAITVFAAAALTWTTTFNDEARSMRLQSIYWIAALFWVIGAWWWIRRNPQHPPSWLVAVLGALALAPFYVALVDLRAQGAALLLGVMGIVWTADIAAYFVGRRFGRRKLAPEVSPGKTVEGAIGALLSVALYALVVTAITHGLSSASWLPVVIALGLGVVSILGDLFESSLKRQAGLKDSGNVLPGHGGILDRIDALLPVLPIAALFLSR